MKQIQFKNVEEGRKYVVTDPFDAYTPEGAKKPFKVDQPFLVENIRNLGDQVILELPNGDWIYGDLEDYCCFE